MFRSVSTCIRHITTYTHARHLDLKFKAPSKSVNKFTSHSLCHLSTGRHTAAYLLTRPVINTIVTTPTSPLESSSLQTPSSGPRRMFSVKPPCIVGASVSDVESPALVVCMDRLERNMEQLTKAMNNYSGVSFRPHIKAHKCPVLAKLQMRSGACGVCCQTLTEAESMVEGGLDDIFISNQVIGKSKLARLASLAKVASAVSVCVDSEGNIEDINRAACDLGVTIDLVVEVNVGQDRCGVEPGPDVVRLAKLIQTLPNVRFKGIQCYNGWNQHVRTVTDRDPAVGLVADKARIALKELESAGIACPYVTGGGTGTFHFEAKSGVFTEVQPGSYLFMDVDYNKNLSSDGRFDDEFKQSLYIIATVQSVSADRAVVDCGLKGVSLDSGVPQVSGKDGLMFHNGGDEHGIIRPNGDFKVGQQVWLVPGHCDPTVNMYSWIVGLRDGKVEAVWPITGRGPGV